MIGYDRLGGDDGTQGRRGRRLWCSDRTLNPADEVLSPVSTIDRRRSLATDIHQLPEERRQLVFRVRREIAEGVYETPEKWELALDRLFESVLADERD
jgi:hypothetical protein